MNNWISVKDELPPIWDTCNCYGEEYAESDVLITNLGAGVYRCENEESTTGEWYILSSDLKYNCRIPEPVTHWMPLPELPK